MAVLIDPSTPAWNRDACAPYTLSFTCHLILFRRYCGDFCTTLLPPACKRLKIIWDRLFPLINQSNRRSACNQMNVWTCPLAGRDQSYCNLQACPSQKGYHSSIIVGETGTGNSQVAKQCLHCLHHCHTLEGRSWALLHTHPVKQSGCSLTLAYLP